jgi:hypothetical protein
VDIFSSDKLILFLIFFVPGFISTKIWSLVVPSDYRKISDYLLEVVSYGCVNFAIWFYPVYLLKDNEFSFWLYIFWLSVLFIGPIVWPLLTRRILKSNFLKGRILHPTSKAWDYFFGTRRPCYVLVHLKNGSLIGGFYGGNSYASSFPNQEEIYLEEVWKVNEEGEFQDRIDSTAGIWIQREAFDYLEFFDPITEE